MVTAAAGHAWRYTARFTAIPNVAGTKVIFAENGTFLKSKRIAFAESRSTDVACETGHVVDQVADFHDQVNGVDDNVATGTSWSQLAQARFTPTVKQSEIISLAKDLPVASEAS